MFDIGFMELVLIAIVSLFVIGPERLPGAVRTASLWIGRAKRSFHQVKQEIEREINADEIRRQLHNESILADLEKAKKKADNLVKETQGSLNTLNAEVNATLKAEETRKKPDSSATASQAPTSQSMTPAAAETNPARLDEEQEETPMPAPNAGTESVAAPIKAEPVVDFYNNPPAGIIKLKNGVFTAAPSADSDEGQQSR